ncbi:hypothetical protein WOLCODRAFT_21243 [Wolfiporia cocos MD-104 SS10]|uniref:Peptidase C14 caspase domain-containing protein n=1 Tax=Wolfiporia cocos (strain MD-104) TaxID=742152 RepID=A0A2H3JGE2_WOLCO|nr:hypothetical protein WOLCODRAFT_21243 [Wolfiporia cocos MD-104 SS10]
MEYAMIKQGCIRHKAVPLLRSQELLQADKRTNTSMLHCAQQFVSQISRAWGTASCASGGARMPVACLDWSKSSSSVTSRGVGRSPCRAILVHPGEVLTHPVAAWVDYNKPLPNLPPGESPILQPYQLDIPAVLNNNGIEVSVPQPWIYCSKTGVFALIISIDIYEDPDIIDLSGCVNDGESVKSYLKEALQASEENILFLQNEAARRCDIISAIRTHLITNEAISFGDSIIFYFSGHGGREEAFGEAEEHMTETFRPYDYHTVDDHGNVVHGISNRAFDELMRELAHEKGNNITAIFDSCYAGGMMSAPGTAPYTGRDSRSRGLSARMGIAPSPVESWYSVTPSYVLLAACRPEETAREEGPDGEATGVFTSALLKTLREYPLGELTYSRLVELLPGMPDQHPICEGINRERVLFEAAVTTEDRWSVYGPVIEERSQTFRVHQEDNGFVVVEPCSMNGIVL